jgi:acyl-coenzyme A thioesterase PaaI-like protein
LRSKKTDFPGAAPESAPYARMIEEMRALQEQVARSGPPDDVAAEAASHMNAIRRLLDPHQVGEDDRVYGKRWDLPGRGQIFVPPLTMVRKDECLHRAHVTFDASHIGAGGVVQGGVIPLVFVELLGLFANAPGKPISRLAYLHTDFRGPVFVDAPVIVEARLLRTEGRKVFVGGSLRDDETELAAAEALFVTPRGEP